MILSPIKQSSYAPTHPTPGVISSNGTPTSTSIPLITTNATGGSGIFTVQWQVSTTSGSGYVDISGATSLSINATGLTPDVNYYFVVIYTETSTGTSIQSLQYLATPWNPSLLTTNLTDEWYSGFQMYQDSGASVPVTAADQTVASWVGRNGNKLTTTGGTMTVKLINSILTPVSVSDNYAVWVLPSISTDKRNFTVWGHLQTGNGWYNALCGLGSDRGVEMSSFQAAIWNTYNPDGGGTHYSTLSPLGSPCVVALDGSASDLVIRRNLAAYSTGSPQAAGTVTGGFLGSLNSTGTPGSQAAAVYHGLCLTKSLSSGNRTLMQSYFNARVPIASDVSPTKNIIALDDSNTAGTGAGGVNWQYYFAWNGLGTTRVVSSAMSGAYFSAGGGPVNGADNSAQIDLEYLAGAGENVICILDTNDFGSLTAAQCLSNRETWADARRVVNPGVKILQPYMPHRISPYVDAAAYNAVIDSFNTLLASSVHFDYRPNLYTAFGGASPPAGTFIADGIHWTAATQLLVYNTLAALI